MWAFIQKVFSFLKSVFSESDGSGSSSRVLIALIICFTIGVGTFLCVELHNRRVTPEQLNNFLSTGGTFVTTTTGPLYLINKGADVMNNRNQNK